MRRLCPFRISDFGFRSEPPYVGCYEFLVNGSMVSCCLPDSSPSGRRLRISSAPMPRCISATRRRRISISDSTGQWCGGCSCCRLRLGDERFHFSGENGAGVNGFAKGFPQCRRQILVEAANFFADESRVEFGKRDLFEVVAIHNGRFFLARRKRSAQVPRGFRDRLCGAVSRRPLSR